MGASLSEKVFNTDGAMWLVWNAAFAFRLGFLITAWCKVSGADAQYVKATPEMVRLFHTLFEVSLPPSDNNDAIENDVEQAKALPRFPVERPAPCWCSTGR